MDAQNKWQNIKNQLSKALNDLKPKERFEINNLIIKKAQTIMQEKSLSLLYDEYGNQLYEKTSDVKNYITCLKTGNTFLLHQDESKLIETQYKNDEFNTDFISYDSIENINKNSVKWDMDIDTDFKSYNDNNLYIVQKKNERKKKILNDGINDIKNYINFEGQNDFKKINKNFIAFVK